MKTVRRTEVLRKCFLLNALSILLFSCSEEKKPFLSSLDAGKVDPLYTTYAAAMERSEFIVDEGYEFHWYDPTEGIDFTTDTGGELGIGFFINGEWIYRVREMFAKPIIRKSYPDMVVYEYQPVQGLLVRATFLVQSSRTAVWEMAFENITDSTLSFKAVPFIRNDYRTFFNIGSEGGNTIHFYHEEFPDSWTRGHDLPFEDTLANILRINRPATAGAFNSWVGENASFPFGVLTDRPVQHQLTGRAMYLGERVLEQSPSARMMLYLDGDSTSVITHNSPLYSTYQSAINQDGYFRMEAGLLNEDASGSTYDIFFYSERRSAGARSSGTIPERKGSFRRDQVLTPYAGPAVPSDLRLTREGGSYQLQWQGSSQAYLVYRRTYSDPVYHLAGVTQAPFWEDTNPDSESASGYFVVGLEGGRMGMPSREINTVEKHIFADHVLNGTDPSLEVENARFLSLSTGLNIAPGGSDILRVVRTVLTPGEDFSEGLRTSEVNMGIDFRPYLQANEELFGNPPELATENRNREMLYWSAFNMMRQVFYPAEGKSSYNYYVFSREPTWGWGHGGQVFHESIAMLAYAWLDPESAMNSQRVYAERQYENGYINYRTGSYLDEIIEFRDTLTSSAPWYAWQNAEIYRITGDREFLEEMYHSSKRFYEFYISSRDTDGDGLCEWGGHAVLESVRDALVAVWDEVGWPSNFEAVDLNTMLVMEAKSLEFMARELGLEGEAEAWQRDHERRAALINETFWDEETGFYYHVDKGDHDFTFKLENDLKRQEIIGFLPLWAGICPPDRAERLIGHLLDDSKFWRRYGVPSLAADDPYYNDKGYWNGPVWVEWNYFVFRGLQNYGRVEEARELADRISEGMILQLQRNHNLWEFYSPDEPWAGYHRTYIWAGIINRMLIEAYTE